MELNEQQKESVRRWVAQGAGLAEIQKRLREELGISMTYMDVRFLAIDMGLTIREHKAEKQRQPAARPPEPEQGEEGGEFYEEEDEPAPDRQPGAGAAVTVAVDRIVKPGSLVSGTVRFSDGVGASWALDRFGRLALQADRAGYKPRNEDLQAFQAQLRKALERHGI
jgi:hypothetical protein